MHISDDDGDDNDDDDENNSRHLASGNRFACEETYLSDGVDSDSESASGEQLSLMAKGGVIEGALLELSHEHQLTVAEEIRTQLSAFGTDLTNEKDKLSHAISQAEKSKEARRELDRERDLRYQRQIAEALDNHLTVVQRHHEYKSQIEEKKIRDDAAIEEAKRKQIALQEEKIRQERMKVEEAKCQAEKKKEEGAKAAALEAEIAAKEAADMAAAESQKKAADALTASQKGVSKGSSSGGDNKATTGTVLKGAESALKLEERRLQMYNEVVGKDFDSKMASQSEYHKHGMQMARHIKTITGSKENVRSKANELLKLMNSTCPQAINMGIFADKIFSLCTNANGNSTLYAYGHVIVMITSQIPPAIDILIAKLNRGCILTVPKYISYSEAAFESKDAHKKAIGFEEADGKLEDVDAYLGRLTLHMKLYGALIQTEVNGIKNLHGIEEGWKWLARFLNAIPANVYTVAALQAFIEVAGFALYRRYKNQFKKLLNIIYRDFLQILRESDDTKVKMFVMSLENYIQSNQFQKEPEGWRLRDSLLSNDYNPNESNQSDHHQQYQNSSRGYNSGYQEQYNYNSGNRLAKSNTKVVYIQIINVLVRMASSQPWTTTEEIVLCKAWCNLSENRENTMNLKGFWSEVLACFENEMGEKIRRYNAITLKWKKSLRPKIVAFIVVYERVKQMDENGSSDLVVLLSTNACSNPSLYAYGHVIVMVTSQDEFESRDAYLRDIGYQEENGKLESIDTYLARLTQHMKLYGALIQTEADGFTNVRGIEEGWKWLFRFLYDLPASVYTAVALEAFIEMAGFALYKRYKNEFKKLLNTISHDFLKVLKEKEDTRMRNVVICLENYIQSNQFLKEPEGWRLRDSLLSNEFNSDELNHQYQHLNLSGRNQGYQKSESNPFHKEPERWRMQENSLLSQGLNPNVSNHQQRDSCNLLNRKRADYMVKLMNSTYPQFVYTKFFADNIVSKSTNAVSNSVLYGYGHVIVMVTSKVPLAMKDLLSKLNEECIFTVPKYFGYSEVVFGSEDAYLRAIGYQEQDGKLESMDTYLDRLTRHMKLYAALIQTEVDVVYNLHGIEEGWKWLARFLNDLPANIYTAVALAAFIEIAGFALYKKYTNQFEKLLIIISCDFLEELKETDDPKAKKVVLMLENYIQSSQFLKEREGRRLLDSSISQKCNPIVSLHQQH
uniref:mRNA export factor GLE1 n=1 Tax=Tanacetum cinerariifolium TaxID=118510 RepID=A0A6L2LNM3_TANCI|nr:protein GLE1 isoform X2 [Tanacetum cinerariifolium]